MNRDNLDFRNEKIGRLFRSLFFPTLIAMVFNSALNLCDGMFVGHGVGPDALAAINIVAPYFLLCVGIGLMFGFGASVIGSIRLSEENVKGARIIMTQAYLAGGVIFATIIALSYIFTDDILRMLGSSDRLLGLARDYLFWLLPGFFFFYLQSVGMMLVRLDGSPKYAMSVQVVAAILNIFLDWLMVFPLDMGITGASIATSVSCVVGGCMVMVYFLFFSSKLKFYRLKRSWKSFRLTLRNVGYMVRIGLATFLQEIAMGGMMVAGNYMFLKRLGEEGVAAFSVGCYLFPIMFSISNAVAQSSQPIISFNYGARNMERVGKALRLALATAMVCGALITVCMWLGAPLLSMVFLPTDSEAFSIAVHGLPLLGLCALFFAVNITLIGYYQSIESVVVSTVYSLLRGIVFVIPAFILLPEILGDNGLWLSIPVSELLTMVIIIAVFCLTRRRARPVVCMLALLVVVAGCREDELVVPAEYDIVGDESPESSIRGFYLMNEGNMGSNKCTLDFYDYRTGLYARNFYAERNPNVIKELGDVGNDIGIYGGKLYVVVNCSHKVEVLDAYTGVRLGQVDIPNCRYVRFYKGKAYVSSYVGPVLIDPAAPKGAVYEVDTLSLDVTRKVTVGYQPEEMEIVDDYMYVANSGGYRAPEYDNTVSVIQMVDFKQVRQIPVDINLHRLKKDRYDKLWVTSRGDYQNRPSRLYVMQKKRGVNQMEVTDMLPVACSNMAFFGDYMYYYATEWNNFTAENAISYGVIDVRTKEIVADNFITDGTEKEITIPYGIAVHPETGDIFVTDAKNYVSSGTLYCFGPDGRKKWSVRTGDIPAHIAFLPK